MGTRTLDSHIEITPGVVGGKPRIAGRRISVQDIVVWHEQMGKSANEIAGEYDLTLGDVYSALAYYFDHREQIDEVMRQGNEAVEALKVQSFSRMKNSIP